MHQTALTNQEAPLVMRDVDRRQPDATSGPPSVSINAVVFLDAYTLEARAACAGRPVRTESMEANPFPEQPRQHAPLQAREPPQRRGLYGFELPKACYFFFTGAAGAGRGTSLTVPAASRARSTAITSASGTGSNSPERKSRISSTLSFLPSRMLSSAFMCCGSAGP